MARMIDADELLERLYDLANWCSNNRKIGMEQAICMVHESPTITQPVEQKHGKWEGAWNPGFTGAQRHCTICGWKNHHCVNFKFCPNCGTKMDQEKNK